MFFIVVLGGYGFWLYGVELGICFEFGEFVLIEVDGIVVCVGGGVVWGDVVVMFVVYGFVFSLGDIVSVGVGGFIFGGGVGWMVWVWGFVVD